MPLNLFDRLLGLDAIDWSGRMSGEPQQDQTASEAQKKNGKEGEEGSPPSKDIEVRTPPLSLNDYTGTFTHPGYGNLVMKQIEDRLSMPLNLEPAAKEIEFEQVKAAIAGG
ncbi:hypothetical protein [Paenibacillus dendritiformis]|uniref:hypothetical protein n=1 Tax=Paenibacillus dendritiformis TaxID=130049 RepID=UPI00387E0321